jgi:hypothetical protein
MPPPPEATPVVLRRVGSMSMTKKIGLLVALAITAVAFVVPAAASASNWKDKGVELTEMRTIPVSGNFSFTGSLGGWSCSNVSATLTLNPGSTGTITSFSPPLSSCKGTGGLSGCTITGLTVKNLPWAIHDEGTFITVGTPGEVGDGMVELTITMSGFFCPTSITLFEKEAKMLRLTPDSTSAINKFTVSGELEASVGGAVTIGGDFTPTNASDLGTYGL